MGPWFFPTLLMMLGLALVVMELFIPSGGILAFLAASSVVGAIVVAFIKYPEDTWVGYTFVIIAVVAVPVVFLVAVKVWPETAIGRRILPEIHTGEEMLPDNEQRRRLRDLVGKVGKTKGPMLPSGGVVFDGRSVDAVSEGMPIDAGEMVRVIEVKGNRVVVRPVSQDEPENNPDDILSQPVDKLGLDGLDEPLA